MENYIDEQLDEDEEIKVNDNRQVFNIASSSTEGGHQ